jgi:hypothetical protein
VTGVHVGVVDRTVTSVKTRETELRASTPESVYDAAILTEGLNRADLLSISGRLDRLLTPVSGVHRIESALYDLAYLLSTRETA